MWVGSLFSPLQIFSTGQSKGLKKEKKRKPGLLLDSYLFALLNFHVNICSFSSFITPWHFVKQWSWPPYSTWNLAISSFRWITQSTYDSRNRMNKRDGSFAFMNSIYLEHVNLTISFSLVYLQFPNNNNKIMCQAYFFSLTALEKQHWSFR